MLSKTLGGHRTINSFVRAKLRSLPEGKKSFRQLYGLMFSEKNNIMFESNNGYQIARTTYGECDRSISGKTAALRARLADIPRNAVIGLYMENSRAWIEAFWAILLSGYRPLLLNLRLDHDNLERALRGTDAKAVLSAGPVDFSVPVILFPELPADGEADDSLPCGEEVLLMSSGTSEHAKVCAYTADAFWMIIKDSYHIIQQCPQVKKHYKGQLKLLTFLPFYHVFGLVAVYIWFSFFSRTFVLLENMSPQTIVNTIRRHEVTHIFAVPMLWNTVYEQAMQTIRKRGEETFNRFQKGMAIAEKVSGVPVLRDIVSALLFREVRQNLFGGSIRFLISGGSEIRPCVLTFFNAIGYHIANGYGMTELGITSVELARSPKVRDQGSVGLPLPSVEYRLNEQGLLEVCSARRASRIFDGAAWTESGDGWFLTGDLAERRDGTWFILGRNDDLVIAPTGENLNPTLVEEGLNVKGIQTLCLIGASGKSGAVPTLLVSPKYPLPSGGLRGVADSLQEALRRKGLERQIQSIVFVREPLIGPNDIKLNRTRIAREYNAGSFTVLQPDSASSSDETELKAYIRAMFAESTGKAAETVGDQSDFFTELGGNSLDYFSMILHLQEKYGVSIPMEDGQTLSTVAALTDHVMRMVDAHG